MATAPKKPLDADGDGDVDYDDFKAWAKKSQEEVSKAFQWGEDIIKKGGSKLSDVVSATSKKIHQALEPLNELGKKIGGVKGGPPRGDDTGARR